MTAQATPVGATGTGAVVTTPCTYRGLSFRDTSGATNTLKLFDNASAASGTVLYAAQVSANQAFPLDNIPDGLHCANGIYLQATGAVEGSVRVG